MSEFKELLAFLIKGNSLSVKQMQEAVERLMNAKESSDAQVGAFLCAMSSRLPTGLELSGGALALREHMVKLPVPDRFHGQIIVDTCGTGGSGLNTFSTSTVCALVLATCGLKVAKHGNRAATSKCGSADLLEAMQIALEQPEQKLLDGLAQTNFCFLFAPCFHRATKRVVAIRKELGFRTIFNFLGPLVNPASVEYQLLGVSNLLMVRPMAESLISLGAKRALVVCGHEGLDELSIAGGSLIAEIKNGSVSEYDVRPEDFGLVARPLNEVQGADTPDEAVKMVRKLLSGQADPRQDLVALNAGAALYLCGQAQTIKEGVWCAKEVVASGAVSAKMEEIINYYHA